MVTNCDLVVYNRSLLYQMVRKLRRKVQRWRMYSRRDDKVMAAGVECNEERSKNREDKRENGDQS